MLANALPIGTRRWVSLTNKKLPIMHRQSVAVGYIYCGNCRNGVARNFSQGVRNSNWLHSPIFNRRPSLSLSRAELWQANALSLATLPQWKLHRSCGDASWYMANTGRRRHIAGGSTHSFNFLDEELGKFFGVDVSWGLHRPLSHYKTRLMKISARARGHTIFDLNGPLL